MGKRCFIFTSSFLESTWTAQFEDIREAAACITCLYTPLLVFSTNDRKSSVDCNAMGCLHWTKFCFLCHFLTLFGPEFEKNCAKNSCQVKNFLNHFSVFLVYLCFFAPNLAQKRHRISDIKIFWFLVQDWHRKHTKLAQNFWHASDFVSKSPNCLEKFWSKKIIETCQNRHRKP